MIYMVMGNGGFFMQKFTIQVFCTKRDDNGKAFRACFCYQGQGISIGDFLKSVEALDWSDVEDVKFGAFLPGHHLRIY